MELRWWLLAAAGIACLATVAATAWLLPVERVQQRLRPLAHVDRLTRLPEFARVQRIYIISISVTAGLLLISALAAIIAAARPIQLAAVNDGFDAAHPLDTMLCIGQPVNDPTTADVFNYYAQRTAASRNGQIGITSRDLRVMPMTRDNAYAEQRLRYFAEMASIQQSLDTGSDVSVDDRLTLAAGIEAFSRSVTYVDYAQSLEDTLALCMTGLPRFDDQTSHRRQLVYVGYSRYRSDDEPRPALYDSGQIQAMAQRGGIQLNAIVRGDMAETSPEGNDTLRTLAEATGGTFALYNPAGTATSGSSPSRVLTADLDKITDNPPPAIRAGSGVVTPRYLDTPQFVLAVAVIAVALLSVSMAVLRR